MNRNLLIAIFVLLTILYIISCHEKLTNPNYEDKLDAGNLSFSINMTNAPVEVKSISGILYKNDRDTIYFDFTIYESYATALVEDLISGEWHLQVNAYNDKGIMIYTGNTSVTIIPNQTISISLQLHPTTGSIDITVHWGDEGDYALEFDGVNDYVLIPHNRKLNFTSSITAEAWIYPYDVTTNPGGGSRIIIRKGNVYHTVNYNMQVNVYAGSGILSFGAGTGVSSPENTLKINQWQHVAGVYNSEISIVSVYVNGELVGLNEVTTIPDTTDDPLTVGLSLRGVNLGIEDFFEGMISDVRIWNTARTQKMIQDNMYKKLTGSEPGLVANWKLDEGSGQIIHNTANGLDGYLGSTGITDDNDPTWIMTSLPSQ